MVDSASFVDEIGRRRMPWCVEEMTFIAVELQGWRRVLAILYKSPRIENGRREKNDGSQHNDFDVILMVHVSILV